METFGHKSGLILIDRPIRVFLNPKNPFTANGISRREQIRVQVPFLMRASYSACIAACQVGLERDDLADFGSPCVRSKVGLSLGLKFEP